MPGRGSALEAFKKDPDCERLVAAFKRVSNILKKAGDVADKLRRPPSLPIKKSVSLIRYVNR